MKAVTVSNAIVANTQLLAELTNDYEARLGEKQRTIELLTKQLMDAQQLHSRIRVLATADNVSEGAACEQIAELLEKLPCLNPVKSSSNGDPSKPLMSSAPTKSE